MLVVLSLIDACRPIPTPVTEAEIPTPTLTIEVTPQKTETTTATHSPYGIDTSTPTHLEAHTIVERPQHADSCFQEFEDQPIQYQSTIPQRYDLEIAAEVLDSLEANRTLLDLLATIDEYLATPLEQGGQWSVDFIVSDVMGDSKPEVVTRFGWELNQGAKGGMISVFYCGEGNIEIIPVGGYYQWDGGGLMAVVDLTGDGKDEIIAGSAGVADLIGRATVYHMVWGWNGLNFEELVPLDYDQDLDRQESTATSWDGNFLITDWNEDGIPDLVLTTKAWWWRDREWSRLERDTQQVWTWNGKQLEMTCLQATESAEYRIQLIEDGQQAIACEDYQAGSQAYQRAIEEEGFLEWTPADNICPGCSEEREFFATGPFPEDSDFLPNPEQVSRIKAYAHLRLLMINVALEESDVAEAELEIMRTLYSDSMYITLAESFWEQYISGVDLTAACINVNTAAEGQDIHSPLVYDDFRGPFKGRRDRETGLYPYDEPICPF